MTAPTLADAYLSPAQVAELLNISPTSVRRAIARGDFPGTWQDGAIVRVPRPAVAAYVDRRTVGRAS